MTEVISLLKKWVLTKIIALQTFFQQRPLLDIDLENSPDGLYGRKSLGASHQQDMANPIPVPYVKHDFEFTWNYKLRIKNNSSKTAYNVKIEKIYLGPRDYLEKLDPLISLKGGDTAFLDYKLRYEKSMTSGEAAEYQKKVPRHVEKLEIIVSCTNEARKKFYTRFVRIDDFKKIYYLISRPKELKSY